MELELPRLTKATTGVEGNGSVVVGSNDDPHLPLTSLCGPTEQIVNQS